MEIEVTGIRLGSAVNIIALVHRKERKTWAASQKWEIKRVIDLRGNVPSVINS